VSMAHEHEDCFRFIAGGTDVIVNKSQGNDPATCLIDITGIADMGEVIRKEKHLRIGSIVSLSKLRNNADILETCPLLAEAVDAVASPVIRQTATLGGNLLCDNRCIFYNQSEWWREAIGYCLKCDGDICIATGGKKNCFSKFVSDLAIALISVNASIEVIEYGSSFILPLKDIYTGNGVKPHKFGRTSLIKSVHVPLADGSRSVFKKLRKRESLDFTSLTTAVTVNRNGGVKIVLGGVDPKPVIIEGTLNDNRQDLIKLAVKKPRIVDNDVFSREYRKEMIEVFLNRSFDELGIFQPG
jgi:4-hydroxybenzoyl-CoA reductase subunit beta